MELLPQASHRAPILKSASSSLRRAPRYDHGMTKVAKITISLPRMQVEQVREAVARGDASSVSSYISAALAAVVPSSATDDDDSLADLVADMIAEHGQPSAEAYAWADEVLGLTGTADPK
jgi:Arc/MetJ-type ribon-helix-helix transcriptional regulator